VCYVCCHVMAEQGKQSASCVTWSIKQGTTASAVYADIAVPLCSVELHVLCCLYSVPLEAALWAAGVIHATQRCGRLKTLCS
jgi:hypothetical protein